MTFQHVDNARNDRADHIWFEKKGGWKCCLCGAVTDTPPIYPTPLGWMPKRYDKLSERERKLCPMPQSGRAVG